MYMYLTSIAQYIQLQKNSFETGFSYPISGVPVKVEQLFLLVCNVHFPASLFL